MKRLLLALLAVIALPAEVNPESIDPEIVKICIKSPDFKGCVLEKWNEERQARYKMDLIEFNKIIYE